MGRVTGGATQWCALGRLMYEFRIDGWHDYAYIGGPDTIAARRFDRAIAFLCTELDNAGRLSFGVGADRVAFWNNQPERTAEEVGTTMLRAAERAAQVEQAERVGREEHARAKKEIGKAMHAAEEFAHAV